MNLEPITQSEVSQKKKDKYCISTYTWNLERQYQQFLYAGQQRQQM